MYLSVSHYDNPPTVAACLRWSKFDISARVKVSVEISKTSGWPRNRPWGNVWWKGDDFCRKIGDRREFVLTILL